MQGLSLSLKMWETHTQGIRVYLSLLCSFNYLHVLQMMITMIPQVGLTNIQEIPHPGWVSRKAPETQVRLCYCLITDNNTDPITGESSKSPGESKSGGTGQGNIWFTLLYFCPVSQNISQVFHWQLYDLEVAIFVRMFMSLIILMCFELVYCPCHWSAIIDYHAKGLSRIDLGGVFKRIRDVKVFDVLIETCK